GPIAEDTAIEANALADHGRIFPESGRPETIRKNDDAGSFGTVVLRSDETTEDSVKAHDLEVGAIHEAGLNFARLNQANHGEREGREIAERAQGFNAGTQILDFGHGECRVVVTGARGALADVDQ